jgi:hypothetical protein
MRSISPATENIFAFRFGIMCRNAADSLSFFKRQSEIGAKWVYAALTPPESIAKNNGDAGWLVIVCSVISCIF